MPLSCLCPQNIITHNLHTCSLFFLMGCRNRKAILRDGGAAGLNFCIILYSSPLASSLDCDMFAKPLSWGGSERVVY